jgi:hypothetical protein
MIPQGTGVVNVHDADMTKYRLFTLTSTFLKKCNSYISGLPAAFLTARRREL